MKKTKILHTQIMTERFGRKVRIAKVEVFRKASVSGLCFRAWLGSGCPVFKRSRSGVNQHLIDWFYII